MIIWAITFFLSYYVNKINETLYQRDSSFHVYYSVAYNTQGTELTKVYVDKSVNWENDISMYK